MDKGQKKRGKNFTEREKEELLEIVAQHKHVVENKQTNAIANKQKQECWDGPIAIAFNSTQTSGFRSGAQLKTLYEQLKRNAKSNKAQDKIQRYKTGSGTFTKKTTTVDEKVLSVISENFFSIDNQFDCNAHAEVEPISQEVDSVVLQGPPTNARDLRFVDFDAIDPAQQNYSDNVGNGVVVSPNEQEIVVAEPVAPNQKILLIEKTAKTLKGKKREKLSKPKADGKKALYEKKIEVLEVVLKVEEANLIAKKIDIEIKSIQKEKELVELEIKREELNMLKNPEKF